MDPITILTILGLTVVFSTTAGCNTTKVNIEEWPDTSNYCREKFKSRLGIVDDIDVLNPENLAKLRKELEYIANSSCEELMSNPDYSFIWDQEHPWFNMPLARWARCNETNKFMAEQRELHGTYADLGPLYASATPVANSVGAEFGIVTRDSKTNKTKRTGIGIYLRSDHIYRAKLDACADRF
jgi:hypothetical protein